jgi:hypothetical protein
MSAPVASSIVWTHAFGQMRIETREDGSVWVDGRLVRDTAPRTDAVSPDAPMAGAEQPHGEHSQATPHPEEVLVDEQLTAEATLSTRSLGQGPRHHDSQVETVEQERP